MSGSISPRGLANASTNPNSKTNTAVSVSSASKISKKRKSNVKKSTDQTPQGVKGESPSFQNLNSESLKQDEKLAQLQQSIMN